MAPNSRRIVRIEGAKFTNKRNFEKVRKILLPNKYVHKRGTTLGKWTWLCQGLILSLNGFLFRYRPKFACNPIRSYYVHLSVCRALVRGNWTEKTVAQKTEISAHENLAIFLIRLKMKASFRPVMTARLIIPHFRTAFMFFIYCLHCGCLDFRNMSASYQNFANLAVTLRYVSVRTSVHSNNWVRHCRPNNMNFIVLQTNFEKKTWNHTSEPLCPLSTPSRPTE